MREGRTWWDRLILAAAFALPTLVLAAVALDRAFPLELARYQERSTLVLDREGRLLRGFLTSDGMWRITARPEAVSALYLAMLTAFEDKRFEEHAGVDPLAMARAIGQAIGHGRIVSGGSTLTMQAARLLEPRPPGLVRKLIEIARAIQLERNFDKSEILSIYLTLAPFGGNLEGIRAASLAYFGKEPAILTPAEAALLVAIPQAPSIASNAERARAARAKVLARAAETGLLTAERAAEAMAAALPSERRAMPMLAPHASERLAAQHQQAEHLGTTLDAAWQDRLERLAAQTAELFGPRVSVAILAAEVRSREIRAWVGSAGYFAERRAGMLDMAKAVRSPGSTLKPFIYGLAFDYGIAHPATLIRDEPRRFGGYLPANFDRGHVGEVSLANALQRSLNMPAVALLERLGSLRFEQALADGGVRLRYPRRGDSEENLALALGGGGVTLEELVRLYTALAGDGRILPLRLSKEQEPEGQESRILSEATAWTVTEILKGSPRDLGWEPSEETPIAFKTGTSYGYRDAWAIGYADGLVIGVWVGRPDNAPCQGCVGITAAAPLLFRAFGALEREPWARPRPAGVPKRGWGEAPAPLGRLERPGIYSSPAGPSLEVAFPPDGIELPIGQRLPLKARGGKRPYRWLIDGRTLPRELGDRPFWEAREVGFTELQVVDAAGRSAKVRLRLTEN